MGSGGIYTSAETKKYIIEYQFLTFFNIDNVKERCISYLIETRYNVLVYLHDQKISNILSWFSGVECPIPSVGSYVAPFAVKTYFYEDTISYQCLVGFVLESGNLVRTCIGTGTWSGDQPNCQGKRLAKWY